MVGSNPQTMLKMKVPHSKQEVFHNSWMILPDIENIFRDHANHPNWLENRLGRKLIPDFKCDQLGIICMQSLEEM